ncbi:D-alanyl-D-alanine carboxypeptidase family protein [Rhabdaerophilum sp. SD176]|uniref:D-alanyl-D-alanine carboxypeptidase family protein n=1 Tax=Rhabdaerophilum sp. SD176 TaxID=2983548 RepID=UPI0024DFE44F|nr:D-alanyl-D-alanine carboxypeptidase family protein [Rhabdaerophilum sp. SD176]
MTSSTLLRLSLSAALAALLAVPAQADPMVPTVVVDAATGEVIQAEEATRPWFPASTTKLMTAYVALRAVAKGQIKLETPIVASAVAAKQPPSKIGIKPGQEITLENALKLLMVKSANDVSTVVAEGIGGSTAGFARMMNQEAARLGMRESHFVNPHGLHHESHVSSARDMALLARALLLEFPQYREYWTIGAVQLGNRKYSNTNGLIGRYPGAMGMKTGFVCASGFNLVSAAERNGRTLIAVVFGATSGADRTLKAAQLLDQGFSSGGGLFTTGAGSGRSLAQLTASPETMAPNRRAEICGRRGPPVAEEEDAGTALAFTSNAPDRPDMLIAGGYRSGQAINVGQRVGGRIALGPRDNFDPIPVYLGRAPGSTEIARRPGEAAAPANATAFAPAAARAGTAAPLALTGTAPLRPGAAGRIGQGQSAQPRPASGASLATRTARQPAAAAARPAPTEPGKAKTKAAADKKKATARKKETPKQGQPRS